MGGRIVGVWLASFVVALGFESFLGVLVQPGGEALGLAIARGVVQISGGALCIVTNWLLLANGVALVPDAWGRVTCTLAGELQGGHVSLAGKIIGEAMCNARLGSECARCNSVRKHATMSRITMHQM